MKCRRCRMPLTANTLSNCPVCGEPFEKVERRNIIRLSIFPAISLILMALIAILLGWAIFR